MSSSTCGRAAECPRRQDGCLYPSSCGDRTAPIVQKVLEWAAKRHSPVGACVRAARVEAQPLFKPCLPPRSLEEVPSYEKTEGRRALDEEWVVLPVVYAGVSLVEVKAGPARDDRCAADDAAAFERSA